MSQISCPYIASDVTVHSGQLSTKVFPIKVSCTQFSGECLIVANCGLCCDELRTLETTVKKIWWVAGAWFELKNGAKQWNWRPSPACPAATGHSGRGEGTGYFENNEIEILKLDHLNRRAAWLEGWVGHGWWSPRGRARGRRGTCWRPPRRPGRRRGMSCWQELHSYNFHQGVHSPFFSDMYNVFVCLV